MHLTLRLALGQLQVLIDRFVSVSANLAFASLQEMSACTHPSVDSNPAFDPSVAATQFGNLGRVARIVAASPAAKLVAEPPVGPFVAVAHWEACKVGLAIAELAVPQPSNFSCSLERKQAFRAVGPYRPCRP